METTVFRTSRVQHRGSKSINLSSENWEPVTPNMVPANSVLSHCGSRRWASADGWLVGWFPSPAPLPLLAQQAGDCLHSDSGAPSLSHLGLHGLRCPFRGCLTDLLQQVVHLEAQRLNLLVPSWQSFTSWKEKKKTTHTKQRKSLQFLCLVNCNLSFCHCPHLTHRGSLPCSDIRITSVLKSYNYSDCLLQA